MSTQSTGTPTAVGCRRRPRWWLRCVPLLGTAGNRGRATVPLDDVEELYRSMTVLRIFALTLFLCWAGCPGAGHTPPSNRPAAAAALGGGTAAGMATGLIRVRPLGDMWCGGALLVAASRPGHVRARKICRRSTSANPRRPTAPVTAAGTATGVVTGPSLARDWRRSRHGRFGVKECERGPLVVPRSSATWR